MMMLVWKESVVDSVKNVLGCNFSGSATVTSTQGVILLCSFSNQINCCGRLWCW
jgi:hypothetical protein